MRLPSKSSEIKKPDRHTFWHIVFALLLVVLIVYLFSFIEVNFFEHGLNISKVLSASTLTGVNPSYKGQLHNDQRKNEVIQLDRLVDAYRHSDGVSGPPSTNGRIVNVDDSSNPLAKPISLINYTLTPDPSAGKYHYMYESDGTSYTISCVQTDDKDENKIVSLFTVTDGKQLLLDPVTRKPIAP